MLSLPRRPPGLAGQRLFRPGAGAQFPYLMEFAAAITSPDCRNAALTGQLPDKNRVSAAGAACPSSTFCATVGGGHCGVWLDARSVLRAVPQVVPDLGDAAVQVFQGAGVVDHDVGDGQPLLAAGLGGHPGAGLVLRPAPAPGG